MKKLFFSITAFFVLSMAAKGQTSREHPTDTEAWASLGLSIDLPQKGIWHWITNTGATAM
jgi:hypothetical protein